MNPKPQPNRKQYIATLQRMGSAERLAKAFELTDMARVAFRAGLQKRHPELSEAALHDLYLAHLARWHNRNY